jgi:hypothetical protein
MKLPRVETWIGQDDFQRAASRRITLPGGVYVIRYVCD